MKKNEFLYKLEKLLKKHNINNYENYLTYYSEYIDDLLEEGTPEDEVFSSIGTPIDVFNKITNENSDTINIAKPKRNLSTKLIFWIGSPIWFPILLSLGLIIVSLLFTISVLIIAFLFTLFAISFAFLLNSIWLMFGSFVSLSLNGFGIFLFEFGLGILSASISLIVWELLIPCIKGSNNLFKNSFNYLNKKGVKKNEVI